MNKNKYIILFFLILGVREPLFAQNILAQLIFDNVAITNKYEIEFDLNLERTDDKWLYWSNGTFQFHFINDTTLISPTIDSILPSNYTITYLPGTSDLKMFVPVGPRSFPTDAYLVTPRIFPGRFSITVAGPNDYKDCNLVSRVKPLKIGRFRIESLNKKLPPTTFRWMEPIEYYQACAYKLNHDSVFIPNILKYYVNDNVEIGDKRDNIVNYKSNPVDCKMEVVNFKAEYNGSLSVRLSWETKSECYNEGFIVKKLNPDFSGTASIYDSTEVTIGSYRGYKQNDNLIGIGTGPAGKKYEMYDSLPYRGYMYCYKLYYQQKISDTLAVYPDTVCVQTPNSVVGDAAAFPNPFSNKVNIYFWFEDDVYVDMNVYDLQGKLVENLIKHTIFYFKNAPRYLGNPDFIKGKEEEKSRMNKPFSHIFWNPSQYAQQGLYEVVIIGTPIKDPTVDKSVAVVKIQYVK